MSGHSKWATIKRKKAATDQARGKLFSKFIKEITIAARHGGGDLEANPRLRTAVAAAKSVNMPANNIERAIKRGTGEIEGVNYEETHYEGYAHGGVALLVEVATDNKNRTAGDVRHIFTKHGGALGEAGSVAYMFRSRGLIVVEKSAIDEDTLIELATESGADDVSTEGESYEVLTPPAAFEAVKEALAGKSIPVQTAELTKVPSVHVPVSVKDAEAVLRLVDALEDHDDVQKVYANFDVPDEVIARLSRLGFHDMRVLGLDPGSRRTGYGVVERSGNAYRSLVHGHVMPPPRQDLAHRITAIAERVGVIIDQHRPDCVAVEEAFYHESVRSTLVLGHVRGALMVAAVQRGIPVAEYSPREIKMSVVGTGGAGKEQVAFMVRRLLGIKGPLQADAADALAVALCHLHRSRRPESARAASNAAERLEALLQRRSAR